MATGSMAPGKVGYTWLEDMLFVNGVVGYTTVHEQQRKCRAGWKSVAVCWRTGKGEDTAHEEAY